MWSRADFASASKARRRFQIVAGEIVLFPRNELHFMGSDLDLPAVPASSVIAQPASGGLGTLRLGGNGDRAQVICGYLAGGSVNDNPLISTLPRVLHLNVAKAGAAAWIRSTFQYAADELTAGRPGSATVLAKLSELLFVEAVRRYLDELPSEPPGWLAGLRDPHVARALALFHGNVARS
jgi:hypothetical protein